jgi:hypothetical protein
LPKCWGALIDPLADFGLNNLLMGNLQNGVSPTYPRALSIIMLGTGTSGTKITSSSGANGEGVCRRLRV